MKIFFNLIILNLLILFLVLLTSVFFKYSNLTPKDYSVLISSERNVEKYKGVGFLVGINEKNDFVHKCSVNYLGNGVFLTAKHCVLKNNKLTSEGFLIGFGELAIDKPNLYQVSEILDYQYGGNPISSDMVILKLEDSEISTKIEPLKLIDTVALNFNSEYCNLEIIGYGLNENELVSSPSNSTRKRHIAKGCIIKKENGVLSVTASSENGFCLGDSGSGLFDTDSGKLLGILSSANNSCTKGNTGVFIDLNEKILKIPLIVENSSAYKVIESSKLNYFVLEKITEGENINWIKKQTESTEINPKLIKLLSNENEMVECGFVDSNNDKYVGFDDFLNFAFFYSEFSRDTGLRCNENVSSVLDCPRVDFNDDRLVNFKDLVSLGKIYKKEVCIE